MSRNIVSPDVVVPGKKIKITAVLQTQCETIIFTAIVRKKEERNGNTHVTLAFPSIQGIARLQIRNGHCTVWDEKHLYARNAVVEQV